MSSYAIVAIPSKQEYVWQVSSESIPHLTLLYLGDTLENFEVVRSYVEHVVSTSMRRFYLSVDRRGLLGPKDADVLFFEGNDTKRIETIRSYFLKQVNIAMSYANAMTYDTWVPHLTLGYPDKPAKSDNRDYPEFGYIEFDKVALWNGMYEGPEFLLPKYGPYDGVDDDVFGMSAIGHDFVDQLVHFGIKGMKWGIRRRRKSGGSDSRSEDSVRTDASRQLLKKHGTKALSTRELQNLVTRMNLEQQYSQLQAKEPSRISDGHDAIKKILAATKTGIDVYRTLNSPEVKKTASLGLKLLKQRR